MQKIIATLILSTCMIYANCACPKKKTSTKKSFVVKPKLAPKVQKSTLVVPEIEKHSITEKTPPQIVDTNHSIQTPKTSDILTRDGTKEVVIDSQSNLMWQDNGDAKSVKKNWEGSIEYCKNLSLAQQHDWRLPTKNELLSITDTTRSNPAIQSRFENVASDYYWSSSSNINYSDFARNVTFYFGIENNNYKDKNYYIRCVRDNK